MPALGQGVIDASIARMGGGGATATPTASASSTTMPKKAPSASIPAKPKPAKAVKAPPQPTSLKRKAAPDPAASDSFLSIYTDGACSGNGKANSRAGLGVWFGPNDPRNLSERVPGAAQTNNRGEVFAAIRALEVVEGAIDVVIYTDSKYLIKGVWCAFNLLDG